MYDEGAVPIGVFNPVIPRVISDILTRAHAFNPEFSLRHRRNETSRLVRLRKSAEILVLGPSCVPGFEHAP